MAHNELNLVDTCRGQWHGDVLIYTFPYCTADQAIEDFWDEVACLNLIRHENIMLFMGACVEPTHLAVITSMKNGPSLHESIHSSRLSLSVSNKMNIARQVAQVSVHVCQVVRFLSERYNQRLHCVHVSKVKKKAFLPSFLARRSQPNVLFFFLLPL